MSHVTSAVIVVDYAPVEVRDLLTEPQTFGREADRVQAFARFDPTACGDSKVLQSDVYAAGLNHISPEHLVDWFRGLPWDSVSHAVLIYDCEGESRAIVPIGDWRSEES